MHYVRCSVLVGLLATISACSVPSPVDPKTGQPIDWQTAEILHDMNQIAIRNSYAASLNNCGPLPEDYRSLDGQIRNKTLANGNEVMTSDSRLRYGCSLRPR